jgi:hypothetical protein
MKEQQINNTDRLAKSYQLRHIPGNGYQPIGVKTEIGVRVPIIPPTGGTGARTIVLKPIILTTDPK